MATESSEAWVEVFEARERLRIDEELFYALLYDYLAVTSSPTIRDIIRYLETFMEKDFDGNTVAWRKAFHALALAQLERNIAALGLPVRRTANAMARREFHVDEARWLLCWQLCKLVYILKTRGIQ
jgi:hypothetical protein